MTICWKFWSVRGASGQVFSSPVTLWFTLINVCFYYQSNFGKANDKKKTAGFIGISCVGPGATTTPANNSARTILFLNEYFTCSEKRTGWSCNSLPASKTTPPCIGNMARPSSEYILCLFCCEIKLYTRKISERISVRCHAKDLFWFVARTEIYQKFLSREQAFAKTEANVCDIIC